MGWEDRRYDDRGKDGWKAAWRRMFVDGDNFFNWSLPLFTAFAIRVKLHLIFLVYIVIHMLMSLSKTNLSPGYTAMTMVSLFGIVLIHEFGHCFACRWVKGEANEILLWPLGGLAMCLPPHNWKANLITTIGGPAVHVIMLPFFIGALIASGMPFEQVFFNPLKGLPFPNFSGDWMQLKTWLFFTHAINIYLFLFNMLLVMFPMDAGRVLHALLWRKMGYERATIISCNVGLVMAVIVGMFGLVLKDSGTMLFAIAIFAGFTCWTERRRIEFMGGFDPRLSGSGGFDMSVAEPRPRKSERQIQKEQEREEQREAEMGRVLAKIREHGMGALTKKERRFLQGETERQRNA